MRRLASVVSLLAAVALAAPAQVVLPPNIRKPIETAKKVADKTSEQIRAAEKAGADPKMGALPAEAAQAAGKQGAAKGAQGAATKTATKADSAVRRGSATQSSARGTVTFYREVFSYQGEGRRDPFLSLMATGELRPMLTDLVLIGVIFDPSGRRSVVTLVDASTGESYRKMVGETLGRMKVTKITEQDVTLSIDEFGFSRQETLPLDRNYKAIAIRR